MTIAQNAGRGETAGGPRGDGAAARRRLLQGEGKCAALYRILAGSPGQWFSNVDLAQRTHCIALSTRLSELRRRLPSNERIECEQRRRGKGVGYYYALIRDGEQAELELARDNTPATSGDARRFLDREQGGR